MYPTLIGKFPEHKIPVAILGATGLVGQKFIELLSDHPWFEVAAVAASHRSAGKTFEQAVQWRMTKPLSDEIGKLPMMDCTPNFPCKLVFSGLDAAVAEEIEREFAEAGYIVISNASHHRLSPNTPLSIPEVNGIDLELLSKQPYKEGAIITNPNCSVVGLCMALKPLVDQWGVEAVSIMTMQALSGAGYPGVPSMDIFDNVIPFISGEEEKLETEPLKIFENRGFLITAHCNRVPVTDGHLGCVSVKLKEKATRGEIISAWQLFKSTPQHLNLPSAPSHPLIYWEDEKFPQPKLHRQIAEGMSVSIGRLRDCSLLDWKFVLLSHNTIRGAAGCAILNAELFVQTFLNEAQERPTCQLSLQ